MEEIPGELLIYDLDRDQAHCLNQTAALVWKHCDGQTTVPELTRLLGQELPAVTDEEVVWLALNQLDRFHLLQGRVTRTGERPRLSRRELVRKAGLAAAVALPMITSIIAPTAAQAGSPCGGACGPGNTCPGTCTCQGGVCI